MVKKYIKIGIIWISLLFICVYFVYVLNNENVALLCIDIKDLFRDNLNVLFGRIAPIALIVTLFCMLLLVKKRAYDYTITVTIGKCKRCFGVCPLKIFHKHINIWVLLSVVIALGCYGVGNRKESENIYPDTQMIIHAMGMIDGVPYTNSLEAFEKHYNNGQRYFEVDFSMTTDGQLVARHDWGAGYQEGIDEGNIPTEEEFLSLPIFGKFTPLSLKDIIVLMQEYPDLYIVTDTKNMEPEPAKRDISLLVQTAEEMNAADVLDRFIVQIYSTDMYEAIHDVYKFPHYIFTLYAIWNGDEDEFIRYCRFCRLNHINTITMWDYRMADNPKLCQIADKYGIKCYVHTVNDHEVAQEMFSLGVAGIYTDDEAVMND